MVRSTGTSKVMVTVSFGENPVPFTVDVLPGGPECGLAVMHGDSQRNELLTFDGRHHVDGDQLSLR